MSVAVALVNFRQVLQHCIVGNGRIRAEIRETGSDRLESFLFLALSKVDNQMAVDTHSDIEVLGVQEGRLVPLWRDHNDIVSGWQHLFVNSESQFEMTVKGALDKLESKVQLCCTSAIVAIDEHDLEFAWVELALRVVWQIGCHNSITLLFADDPESFRVAVDLLI